MGNMVILPLVRQCSCTSWGWLWTAFWTSGAVAMAFMGCRRPTCKPQTSSGTFFGCTCLETPSQTTHSVTQSSSHRGWKVTLPPNPHGECEGILWNWISETRIYWWGFIYVKLKFFSLVQIRTLTKWHWIFCSFVIIGFLFVCLCNHILS